MQTNPASAEPATAAANIAVMRVRSGLSAKGLLFLSKRRATRTERLDQLCETLAAGGRVVRIDSPALLTDHLQEAFGRNPAPSDLTEFLEEVGRSAAAAGIAYVLVVDDLHCTKADQLSALIAAFHRAAQDRLPLVLFGSGSPRLRRQIGNAKPYAERMFDFIDVDERSTPLA